MHARALMSTPVITCHVDDSLETAARLMWEHDRGALPVVDDWGNLAGMITDRDTCMCAYTRGGKLAEIPVHAAMASYVISATPDQKVDELEQLMAAYQIHRIPIVEDRKPIGMVSLNDLAMESAAQDTRIKHGLPKIAYTLAAIGHPRGANRAA